MQKFLFFSRIKLTITVGYPTGSTWHKHKLKHKTTSKQRLYELFITRQKQKARNKNKIRLPPNKHDRLTPLARHNFNDAHMKDTN